MHAICLLDMTINNRFEEPYNKFPKDGPIPLLSKPLVISKLSKKFWLYTQYLRNQNLLKNEEYLDEQEENLNMSNNDYEDNNFGEQFQRKEDINFNINKNIRKGIRPKSTVNNGNYKARKNNRNFENENEINELKEIIFRLKKELNKQDFIINSQINEKLKLQKRIQDLEQVLKNFC